jgi:LuxR family maltose regulon positive regulatory protein
MTCLIRATIALYIGDGLRCIALAQQTLELLPETDQVWRLSARVHTIRNHFVSGDVRETSIGWVEEVVASVCRSRDFLDALGGIIMLARLQTMQGRLRQAAATFERAMLLIPEKQVLERIAGNAVYYFLLGEIHYEWNDLVEAEHLITQGMRLTCGDLLIDARSLIAGYTILARLQRAIGEDGRALEALDAFITIARERHFVPWMINRITALRAHFELAQGNLTGAIRWAEECGLNTEDQDLSYLYEREYLTLARVRIAQGRKDSKKDFLRESLQLLVRLQQEAENCARMGSVLEILILRVLALHSLDQQQQALHVLGQAVALAQPEGYIRLFVDEGKVMGRLLMQLQATDRSAQGYLQTLLAAYEANDLAPVEVTHLRPLQPLIDPLSERELEILRLLAGGASNAAIAEQLIVATSTVKRHVSNILSKLAVNNRTEAVARARELQIL